MEDETKWVPPGMRRVDIKMEKGKITLISKKLILSLYKNGMTVENIAEHISDAGFLTDSGGRNIAATFEFSSIEEKIDFVKDYLSK